MKVKYKWDCITRCWPGFFNKSTPPSPLFIPTIKPFRRKLWISPTRLKVIPHVGPQPWLSLCARGHQREIFPRALGHSKGFCHVRWATAQNFCLRYYWSEHKVWSCAIGQGAEFCLRYYWPEYKVWSWAIGHSAEFLSALLLARVQSLIMRYRPQRRILSALLLARAQSLIMHNWPQRRIGFRTMARAAGWLIESKIKISPFRSWLHSLKEQWG
jgi:hypothetical protein